jgi:hypothetical protein
LNFVRNLLIISFPITVFAGSNSIKEIPDQATYNDSRYYPRILQIEPTKYGAASRTHCPYEELRILSKKFDPSHLRDEVASMGDLIGPLRHWNLSPECFDKDIHHQLGVSKNKLEGVAMGVVMGVGQAANLLVGIELVLVKLDSETMSIALFAFEGAGLALSLLPAHVGLVQGLLQGNCPDGVHSYAGGFTNFSVGFDSWSFGTGDFPQALTAGKLQACSSYVKLSGLSGLSAGVSQTFYHLLSPLSYKIRGPSVTKLIAWLDKRNQEPTQNSLK